MKNGIIVECELPSLIWDEIKKAIPHMRMTDNANMVFHLNIDTDEAQKCLVALLSKSAIDAGFVENTLFEVVHKVANHY